VVGTELVDVATGAQLWGERYNRKLSDIFELEEEIARKISGSLRK
jgi:TolB-like protein